MGITIGPVETANAVFLAPMSGITDAPMRRLAREMGAGLVISEMVASEALGKQRGDVVRRARAERDAGLHVVQLAGREGRWMAEGARLARDLGADIIDINMGCPAKQVTNGLSGSALMRDPDHALRLIEATVSATDAPVTLKMRLGWDENTMNAPAIARAAEAAGIRAIAVHGRTRCQFYKGQADWARIADVKRAVSIPVIANGDLVDLDRAKSMLAKSGADGVMVGRGANGRPWFPGQVSRHLAGGDISAPALAARARIVQRHYRMMLSHYGVELGVRCARKHLGWYVHSTLTDFAQAAPENIKHWRGRLCREDNPREVERLIDTFFHAVSLKEAA